ncbi:hypothetical protein PIIN_10931 [Serendipita indica DSM 11827]|uniref:Uncharacterized protein n=1 Tax=Serendipita indica (strain DSM 11827) TaxID=1109443 RepID=G4U055_SERID|nr:hypothetical protein PIIN_10931 [Serendipita indica DSM 11827]
MCYRILLTELYRGCGHSHFRQPFVDCNSPNCVRSEYHTTQKHQCTLTCKQALNADKTVVEEHGGPCPVCK